jgi:pimeloyl-ACP methyl ester carboxylesterase
VWQIRSCGAGALARVSPEEKKMSVTTHPVTQSNLWLRHIFIVVAAITILLAAAGMIYQILASARDRRAHPLSGQLVDVGGYTMHINCTGQGTPTVILDSGLGDSYISWNKVQPELAKRTRVCSYDRAGLGFSDASPHPRTSKNFAEELHTLLRNAGIAGPLVLVGHSMGGFDVRLYASLYPQDVAGMVLVDSSHPEQQKRFPPAVNDLAASDLRQQEFLAAITPFGIPRILGFCGSDAEIRAAECNFHSAREGVAELRAFATSAAQTATTGSLGNIPLVVLSHDPNTPQPDLPEDLVKPFNDAWEKMQEELAQLSPRSARVIAKNSGHYIQLDRPDLVIEAVRNVVDQARQVQAVKESKPRISRSNE